MIIFALVYAASVIGAYFEIRRMYMEDFLYIEPEASDLFLLFCPFLNTVFALGGVFRRLFRAIGERLPAPREKLLNKFFGVKR